jgi:hypothetical protein
MKFHQSRLDSLKKLVGATRCIYRKVRARWLSSSTHFYYLIFSPRNKMAESVGTLHQWDYLFAFGVIFCALDAYNIGANE